MQVLSREAKQRKWLSWAMCFGRPIASWHRPSGQHGSTYQWMIWRRTCTTYFWVLVRCRDTGSILRLIRGSLMRKSTLIWFFISKWSWACWNRNACSWWNLQSEFSQHLILVMACPTETQSIWADTNATSLCAPNLSWTGVGFRKAWAIMVHIKAGILRCVPLADIQTKRHACLFVLQRGTTISLDIKLVVKYIDLIDWHVFHHTKTDTNTHVHTKSSHHCKIARLHAHNCMRTTTCAQPKAVVASHTATTGLHYWLFLSNDSYFRLYGIRWHCSYQLRALHECGSLTVVPWIVSRWITPADFTKGTACHDVAHGGKASIMLGTYLAWMAVLNPLEPILNRLVPVSSIWERITSVPKCGKLEVAGR